MTTGNSIADQGDKEYNRRGLCPDCKRELILADELECCFFDGKCGKEISCGNCKDFSPAYLCECGFRFEELKNMTTGKSITNPLSRRRRKEDKK